MSLLPRLPEKFQFDSKNLVLTVSYKRGEPWLIPLTDLDTYHTVAVGFLFCQFFNIPLIVEFPREQLTYNILDDEKEILKQISLIVHQVGLDKDE